MWIIKIKFMNNQKELNNYENRLEVWGSKRELEKFKIAVSNGKCKKEGVKDWEYFDNNCSGGEDAICACKYTMLYGFNYASDCYCSWNPVLLLLCSLSKKFPKLKFKITHYESDNGHEGVAYIENGNCSEAFGEIPGFHECMSNL